MGHDARLKRPLIIQPQQDRTVPIDQMSKMQIARALNEQTERFTSLRAQWQLMTRIVVGACLEPDALRAVSGGGFTIDKAVLEKVTSGMAITIDEEDDVLRIRLQQRPEPDVATKIGLN